MIPLIPYRPSLILESRIQWTPGRFDTSIYTAKSGKEERVANWDRARGRGVINLTVLDPDQLAELEALFFNCRGMAAGWLFRAPNDYISETTVDVGGNPHKRYSLTDLNGDTHTYDRPLTRLIPGTTDGAYCQYYTPVRFDVDELGTSHVTPDLSQMTGLAVVEILEDFA